MSGVIDHDGMYPISAQAAKRISAPIDALQPELIFLLKTFLKTSMQSGDNPL
ncbi:hypothetical protein [Paenibacillus sp. UNC496MF]|uniref:hypothetical protein n=1 Tax=Paenibacillus sp. UNC496MF TaxID=1502753 RepID=UPI0015A5638A|nr:hypothetical protein [Paenibacillus sp. UNC496MF]